MKSLSLRLAAAIAAVLALASPSFAQNYPNRPITLIVPFAPGGPADVLGRLVGQKMSEDLGQQVVIDNRSGANTIVGAQFVARAQPDGYTILLAIDGTLVMNPFLYAKLAYDPFKDFDPVSLIALVPSAITANIKTPVNDVEGHHRRREGQARYVPDRREHADLAGSDRPPQHPGRHQHDDGPLSGRHDADHEPARG